MDQNFNGHVDQVAGGNINNYGQGGGKPLAQCSIEKLEGELALAKQLIWQARQRLFLYLPNFVLSGGLLGMCFYALSLLRSLGELASNVSMPVAMTYVILLIGVPMYLVNKKREEQGAIIYTHKQHIRAVKYWMSVRKAQKVITR